MKLTVVGIGPGDPELITIKAIRIINEADLVLMPRSQNGRFPVSEQILKANIPDIESIYVTFPMLLDSDESEIFLMNQLERVRDLWQGAEKIVLPVIGDSALYSTGFYLFNALKNLMPSLEIFLVPGISAHQLASSRVSEFLAAGQDVFSVIPCGKSRNEISEVLKKSDSAALYKPSMLRGALSDIVTKTGPWRRIIRIDRAGLSDEKIYEGKAALENNGEYLSVLILWRK